MDPTASPFTPPNQGQEKKNDSSSRGGRGRGIRHPKPRNEENATEESKENSLSSSQRGRRGRGGPRVQNRAESSDQTVGEIENSEKREEKPRNSQRRGRGGNPKSEDRRGEKVEKKEGEENSDEKPKNSSGRGRRGRGGKGGDSGGPPIVESHLQRMIKQQQGMWKSEGKEEENEEDHANKKPSNRNSKRTFSPTQLMSNGHFSEMSKDMIERISSEEYECMICCEPIKHQVAVWNCDQCFRLFHIFCIKKWSKSNAEGEENSNVNKQAFRCPACQYVHVSRIQSTCYCRKTKDPVYSAYLIPHSCGESCGKQRKGTSCPHSCTETCHPGPCPPCSALSPPHHCFCAKIQYRTRCGEKDNGKSCGEKCGKLLSCGLHRCSQVCHDGQCAPCEVPEQQRCYCGKKEEVRNCGSGRVSTFNGRKAHFSCAQLCDRLLDCGNHKCTLECHSGPCEPCKTSPKMVENCPCGKIPLELLLKKPRTSCLDPIPNCPNKCGKKLSCGIHECTDKCHSGPCSDCEAVISAPCRCHNTSQKVKCLDVNGPNPKEQITCGKQCKSSRNCGRHVCGVKCCSSSQKADPQGLDVEGNHICSQICARKLKCGKHDCDLLCHPGKCLPCHVTLHEPYICECGSTRVDPPILCNQKMPECKKECVREKPCGHKDHHICHSRDVKCPPCTVLVQKECVGGHNVKRSVACYIQEVLCGRSCNKPLECGVHLCKRMCHSGPCKNPLLPNQQNEVKHKEGEAISCGGICGRPREFCTHTCAQTCHGDTPCPKIPCKNLIVISCPCKRKSLKSECFRGGEDDSEEKGKSRELVCDEICEKEIQNKKLAEALGINQKQVKNFSEELMSLGRISPSFILKTEKVLEDFLKSGRLRHMFSPMDRVQRKIIHELVTYYSLDSESTDYEPNRCVVITRRRDSCLPSTSLSSALGIANRLTINNMTLNTAESFPLEVSNIPADHTKKNFLSFLKKDLDPTMTVQWIDESTALLFFRTHILRKSAASIIGGQYTVKEFKDQEPVDSEIEPLVHSKTTKPKFVNHDFEFEDDSNLAAKRDFGNWRREDSKKESSWALGEAKTDSAVLADEFHEKAWNSLHFHCSAH
eukprot:TRINITY_DN6052_c0_g4_i4.p1 TRINITY_DN6052_c0_g4~~TRINITY_DN6052_c0_g4_i4.p1  ORF type:complete len:1098 (+),score=309.46 TRINITY_DN6052_c0_g4_i4:146-3439(+)